MRAEPTLTGRAGLVVWAVRLEWFSVLWGLASASWSVTAGLLAGSLGVLGLGLNVIADVAGSASLVWRFKVEQSDPDRAARAEARAVVVVAAGLTLVAVFLGVDSIRALLSGSGPGRSTSALVSAGTAVVVSAPLGAAKYRIGRRIASSALRGDGTLSCLSAGLGIVALLGLLLDRLAGWWWADRAAALAAATFAATEAVRVLHDRPRPPHLT